MKLQRATPESTGVSSQAILNFLKAAKGHEMHSFMLLKGGKVICERWWEPFGPQYRHQLYSLSKSFTSTAIGMAVDEGRLTVDTLLSDIFKAEFEDLDNMIDDEVHRMTVKHLLVMSTGMEYENWNWEGYIGGYGLNHILSFLSAHVKDAPGQTFRYSSIATYMLSAIITRLTGETLVAYLRSRLFEPLDITPHWALDERVGIHMGGFGLNITTEGIAKFGQLYLQKGQWEGKQLVSSAWVEEATSKQIENGKDGQTESDSDWGVGYGYQFWRCKYENAYRGDGMFGQFCVVVPDMDIVVVINSNVNLPGLLDLVWQMLDDIRKQPADGSGADVLAAYNNLSHLDTSEAGEDYPTFMAEYIVESVVTNFRGKPQGKATISLLFDIIDNECLISVKSADKPFGVFRFVKGEWTKGAAPNLYTPFSIPNEEMKRVITYGVWKDRTFEVTTWHYESASRDQHRFTFNEDFSEVTMESRTGAYDSEFEVKGVGKHR
ncbi:MAG: beta-lactamase family protein [Defluviitaleaceae bacterium]|nr:beta-lactamase family protein [Defluviitaleaceae bacterium]